MVLSVCGVDSVPHQLQAELRRDEPGQRPVEVGGGWDVLLLRADRPGGAVAEEVWCVSKKNKKKTDCVID